VSERLFRQAVQYHQAGKLAEAEILYRRILAAEPEHADSLHLLGVLAAQIGRNDAAIDLIAHAIRLQPRKADYHNNLGLALGRLGRLDEAAVAHEMALRLKRDHREAHNNLGNIRLAQHRFEAAERSYRAALALDQNYVEAHANLAVALAGLERLDAAEAHCRAALRLNPYYVEALNNLGDILRNGGRLAEAEKAYRQALGLRPDFAPLHYNLAGLLLLTGRFEAGWAEYEWRNRARGGAPRFPQPQWRGEPLAGRTLLLTAEQGAGDAILFSRYAPLAAEQGRVLLEAPAPLHRLFASLKNVEMVAAGEALPPFDLQCPLPSLPFAFGTRLDTIPVSPYLRADPVLAAMWRARLDELSGYRVGLAWAGNPEHQDDRRRSITVRKLDVFSDIEGVSFVSLQKGAADRPSIPLADWTEALDDFADTAALIAGLDLVISVDTSIAHLAGALGKPVWLLNRFDPHWVWLTERDDCPWYPSLRQFRQPSPGDWASVLDTVRTELSAALRTA